MKGRIDCRQVTGITSVQMGSTIFVSIYKALKALETAGLLEEVANYSSSGYINYWDESNPIDRFAHCVFRMPPSATRDYSVYMLVQYADRASDASNMYVNGANQTSLYGWIGIDFAAAVNYAGVDANPWAGTTGKAMADAKANPTWVKPSGGKLWVGNRSNNTGGSNAATMRDTRGIYFGTSSNPATTRWSIIADEDNIAFVTEVGDDDTPLIVGCFKCDIPTEIKNVTTFDVAMFHYRYTGEVQVDGIIGNTAGNDNKGELCVPYASDGAGKLGMFGSNLPSIYQLQPSTLVSKYMDGMVDIGVIDGVVAGYYGKVSDFFGLVANVACYDTLATTSVKNRIVYGTGTLTHRKVTLPWDGATTPQGLTDRDGITV